LCESRGEKTDCLFFARFLAESPCGWLQDDIKNPNEIDRMVVMRSRTYSSSIAWWQKESVTHNYPQADEVIFSVVDTGFTVIGVLGEGTVWSMPTVEGRTVCPNDLGTQTYLSLLYRYARHC